MTVEGCICAWVDIGVGFQRVSNEPGCPVHFPMESERPEDTPDEEMLDYMRQRLHIELERRHEREQRDTMVQARLIELRQTVEIRNPSVFGWIARELDAIVDLVASARVSDHRTPDIP